MAHPGGRPLKFPTVDALQQKIDSYFDVTPISEWMITGLAVALGCDRDTLLNYTDRPEFFGTIKEAKTKIEMAWEKRLVDKGRSGDIFALKNFGWRDSQDVNLGGQKDNPLGIKLEIVRHED